ncbi:hypothetical protein BT93_F3078 [Corymbia citriodora subsp. variegata]|nr:hypothetical protein BT93_F3078 [Corymbia citriodora subsp. variegata]
MMRNRSPWESLAYSHPNNSESTALFCQGEQWKELYGYVIKERRFVWYLWSIG